MATTGLMVLHVMLAALATMHVLLRKRDVGTSIGWIGLTWLSPFLGAGLYWLLGINRVANRARALRRPPGRPPADADEPFPCQLPPGLIALDRTARRLTGHAALPGNRITPLRNGDAAYPRMLEAIEAAAHSVLLSSYILRDDAAGRPILDALIRAHERGLAVRVLVDGIGGGYFLSPAWRRLRRHGVPAARFMHTSLPWRMPFLNLRSHKKLLILDGRLAFTGGLNIGRENLLASNPPHPVRDIHFAIEGPVTAQLVEAFARDWHWAAGDGDPLPPPAAAPLPAAGEVTARIVTSGPDQDLEKIETLTLQAIACAQHSILVLTPYFLPDSRVITALSLAALRGVAVDIVVPQRSDHPFVDWGMHAHVDPILRAGCHIWYNPPPFDHSKLMVVDGGWSLIGSSNWDTRSFRLNFELDVEIYDAAMAAALADVIRQRRGQRLLAAELAQRSLPVRLRDAAMRLALPYI
ncbi:PLDc N-terminal domain-containing protein [Belnapia sp. T18]|uniref:Phospholipase D n=1 Tax=Belnapia arida TaxID=2804533 RepID=A0ABS1UA03_9PROT|nr:phospholipase D-like domain-containing protein [Belnapia arida]MBL6081518.1 PLDc N-terminal domain-containing protein [Belnapia arida]